MMNKTKELCQITALTALYVVLSAFVKFYVGVGHIQLDLGYLAFAYALCEFGVRGTAVGVIGCAINTILFGDYGFSVSWAISNAIIGIGCGAIFQKHKAPFTRALAVVLFSGIGFVGAKTAIECAMYSIPVAVKLPKSIAAFVVDSIVMIFGILLHSIIRRRMQNVETN